MKNCLLAQLIISLSLACSWSRVVAAQPTDYDAVKVAAQFVYRELEGDQEARRDLALFTPDYLAEIGRLDDPLGGEIVFWTSDSIVVVESCSIVSTDVRESNAEVIVECRPLLRSMDTTATGRRFVEWDSKLEQMRLVVIRKSACWFVVNPPPPHISLHALVEIYENEVAQTTKNFGNNPRVSSQQWEHLDRLRETRDFLKAFAASRPAAQPK